MVEGRLNTDAPDEELVRTARVDPGSEGARQASCLLLSRYRDRVYAWCYRRLGDPDEALDAAQEVLLSAYRNLERYEPRAQFGTWLFAIARNRCISRRRRSSLVLDGEVDPVLLSHPGPDPAQLLIDKMSEQDLLDIIRKSLDPLEQEVLWLRCNEEMPVDRITELLGIQQASGARGILQRARRKIRGVLARTVPLGEISG